MTALRHHVGLMALMVAAAPDAGKQQKTAFFQYLDPIFARRGTAAPPLTTEAPGDHVRKWRARRRSRCHIRAMEQLDPQACYRALQTRDARFDGRIFVGVLSTGIYCRPICPART